MKNAKHFTFRHLHFEDQVETALEFFSLLTIHTQRTPRHSVAYLSFSNPHLFREDVVRKGGDPGEKDGPEECRSKPQRSAPPPGTNLRFVVSLFLSLSWSPYFMET